MIDHFFNRLEAAVDRFMPDSKVTEQCTGNLLCMRTGKRHKKGCIGRVGTGFTHSVSSRSIRI